MKTYLWKFNKDSERIPLGSGDKWVLIDIETKENIFTDYLKINAPLKTDSGDLDLGHGMVITGNIVWKEHPKVGKYIEFQGENHEEFPTEGKQMRGIKLDIPNLSGAHDKNGNKRVANFTWRIYEDILDLKPHDNKYFGKNIEYVHAIDIDNVTSWTGNNILNIGWSLLTEGDIEYFTDPDSGLRYARIYKK